MNIRLPYGTQHLQVSLPDASTTVLEPRFVPGVPDEPAAFRETVRAPIRCPPLKELVRASDSVAVVIPDITRPFPSDRVLPWLFQELSHVSASSITIVVGTGSHRANTPDELTHMLGAKILASFHVVNHNAHDAGSMLPAGRTPDGRPVSMNREYVKADRRIILGFVEPHFFAGFSGGYKAVMPGIVDIDSILHYHRAALIGHPASTWGITDGNPTQEHVRAGGSLLPVDFCVNVTLNRQRAITGFFCGDVLAAHAAACRFAKATAMASCDNPFPLVLTTNGGYPLDQNLYQAVKGMSAAAQIVTKGGLIVMAAQCSDGFPSHGNFRKLLFDHPSPESLLQTINAPGFSMFDQWEAQKLAMILQHARVALHSEIPDDEVRRAHLEPAPDLQACIAAGLRRAGHGARIAILPDGPMTIPYIAAP